MMLLFPLKHLWMVQVPVCPCVQTARVHGKTFFKTIELHKACINFYSVFNKHFQDGLNISLQM